MSSAARYQRARQETGAPFGHEAEAIPVEARISALDGLTTDELRIEWQRLYRAMPPARLSRDLLMRGIAYKIQEQVYGGVSPRSVRFSRGMGLIWRGVGRNASPSRQLGAGEGSPCRVAQSIPNEAGLAGRIAKRYAADLSLIDWAAWLRCSVPGSTVVEYIDRR